VLDHYGKIDILVNNAGTVWGASAIEHSPETWRKVMGLNVDACFRVPHTALSHFQASA